MSYFFYFYVLINTKHSNLLKQKKRKPCKNVRLLKTGSRTANCCHEAKPYSYPAVEKTRRRTKKTPELYLEHKNIYSEEFVFQPEEDIMVYPDFPYIGYPVTDLEEQKKFEQTYFHRHEFFELFYIYEGTCYCYFNEKEYVLEKGSAWIFNTQCRHAIVVPNDGSLLVNIIVRKSTFIATMLNIIQQNDLFLEFFLNSIYSNQDQPRYMKFNIHPGDMAEFYIFNIIREYYQKSRYSQSAMKLSFSSLLIELSRLYYETHHLIKNDVKPNIVEIISYISDHFSTVTLKSLSEHFHYSTAYLSRCISNYTNMTFSEYVNQYKMDKARYLLKNSELPIDQIAHLLGYHQRSSFEKEFKKLAGKTPSQYRKIFSDTYL